MKKYDETITLDHAEQLILNAMDLLGWTLEQRTAWTKRLQARIESEILLRSLKK